MTTTKDKTYTCLTCGHSSREIELVDRSKPVQCGKCGSVNIKVADRRKEVENNA